MGMFLRFSHGKSNFPWKIPWKTPWIRKVNYFETSIRHLGGLLSAYVFSQRPGLLLKAIDLAQRLAQADGTLPPWDPMGLLWFV